MPRGGPRANSGGWRPGAGRRPKALVSKEVAQAASEKMMSPLEYLLSLVADVDQPHDIRMRAAGMALPYVHPKAEAAEGGKKAQREAAARVAERGTDWESLLTAAPN